MLLPMHSWFTALSRSRCNRNSPEAPESRPDAVVGFVGLGTMGSALSAHLLAAGCQVTGYDIDPARLAEHAARGGLAATSPAGAPAGADGVLTYPRTAPALREVIKGAARRACR